MPFKGVLGRSVVFRAALLILLVLPVFSGQGPGSLSASQATLAGSADIRSTVGGIVVENDACGGAFALSLSAAQGVLTVDEETTQLWVNPTVGTNRSNAQRPEPLSDASADGFVLRDGCRILVLPLEGATLEATGSLRGGEFLAPTSQGRSLEPRASFNRTPMAIAAGALPFKPAQAESLTLHGPFRLAVWEASFLLHDRNGTRDVHTGPEIQPPVGDQPLPVGRRVQREAFLDVNAGTLSVTLTPAVQAFMTSLQLAMESGRLRLHDPSGALPVSDAPVPTGSRLLELESPTTLLLGPADGRVGVDVRDAPPVAYLDGVAIRPEPSRRLLVPLTLGTLAVAALALAVRGLADRRAARRMDELDALLERQRYGEALALSRRLGRGRRREGARLAEATCLIQMARFREASAALDRDGWSAATGPLRDYLLATAEAGSGQTAAATRHLARCLLKAPSFAAEALANPLLGPVVRDALAANRGPPVAGESYA